jgi:DNA-binding response OmpR family regulator
MSRPLEERSILIVEDEPLIALDLETAFERVGANVITTSTLRAAMALVDKENLSAAVLDHALGDGNSSHLCERLHARGIPFVIYSGFPRTEGGYQHVPHVSKPASPEVLVTTVLNLLQRSPNFR